MSHSSSVSLLYQRCFCINTLASHKLPSTQPTAKAFGHSDTVCTSRNKIKMLVRMMTDRPLGHNLWSQQSKHILYASFVNLWLIIEKVYVTIWSLWSPECHWRLHSVCFSSACCSFCLITYLIYFPLWPQILWDLSPSGTLGTCNWTELICNDDTKYFKFTVFVMSANTCF